MKISILVEGKTEKAFKPFLITYLQTRLPGKMPKLDMVPYDGRIPTGEKLKRVVENLLNAKKEPSQAVIALTDVYTGSILPRQESFASLHILTRRASEGSEALPSLARRVRMSFFGAKVI